MQLTFLGGADEVGASATLIDIAGKRILVDAGVRVSAKASRTIDSDQLPDLQLISASGGIDYLLVTHGHTDHTGALPLLLEQYPQVPVLATQPTIDLIRVLQADAQRIMKLRQDQEGELPLFDEVAVERLLNALQPVEFRQAIHLGEGLQVTYHPSGHIIGAASLVLESDEGTLVMSGDVSMTPQRAVKRAEIPNVKADLVVLESTYGGKLHANRVAEEKRLIETLTRIVEQGGKAIIPAFALGRAQEVIQILLHYQSQLDVPVYVDGMVRAVCRAYGNFRDILPPETIEAAGEDNLFFRNKVRSVTNLAQRSQLVHSSEPAIFVSSSGMLTGGPSAYYAAELAGDPRNAILLTGYQDEESPGRFLQKLLKEHEPGKETPFRIGKNTVTLRCTLGTYSLSAHADEAELVSVAQSLEAGTVALVHGDPGARHSLAARLREREKRVILPVSGQSFTFAFPPRPGKVGRALSGSHTQPVDPAALWDSFKVKAGSFYHARELAKAWWGDESRVREMIEALVRDGLYFRQDWRQRASFQVHTPQQVQRIQRQRAILNYFPDLAGSLVVLRDVNKRIRIGAVVAVGQEKFEAVVWNAEGRQYAADALAWSVGQWPLAFGAPGPVKQEIKALLTQAKAVQALLLPISQREQLVQAAKPVHPDTLLPAALPEGVTPLVAKLAVILALAEDGAHWTSNGLLPRTVVRADALEMNQARQAALAQFPPEARLRKVGLEANRKRMVLYFDFPTVATERYAEQIEALDDLTGWQIVVAPEINQQALGNALLELLPSGGKLIKGPSFFIPEKRVEARFSGVTDLPALAAAFQDLSGFALGYENPPSQPTEEQTDTVSNGKTARRIRMELNAAYALLRDALEPLGMYKSGFQSGIITLSFISPQVGARHIELIKKLEAQIGYQLMVYRHPNQNALLQVVTQILRDAGWTPRKGPGLRTDLAQVRLKLDAAEQPDNVEQVAAQIEQATGYKLVIEP